MNAPKIQAFVSVALGLVLIVVGVMQRNKRKKILEQGIEVEGEIADVLGDSAKGGSGRPVIRFTTKDQVQVAEPYKISVPFSKKGERVLLMYNPDKPKEFIVKKIL